MVESSDIQRAAERLRGIAHRTPVLTSQTLDAQTGGRIFMKAENFQRGGAFKIRGAANKILSLSDEELRRGVATFSSGNHAQAVALAARHAGSHAVILMPDDAPRAKVDATRGYGAEVVTYDRYREDRTALGEKLAADRGLVLVPPYDDELIIAGQGTLALELFDQCDALDMLVVPVGGGGLISGCAIAARNRNPRVRIIGVEPEEGDDTRRSLAAGRRVKIPVPRTIADALQAESPGKITFDIVRRCVDEIATVTDDEIVRAMAFAFDRMKIVIEPAGASGLAAVLSGKLNVRGHSVGIVLSGGNVGVRRFIELTSPLYSS